MGLSRFSLTAVVLSGVLFVSLARPDTLHAQDMPIQPSTVEANVKGTIGLGIIGAELGFIAPAIAGLDDTWAYIVFPLIGAGGGAVGGYFLVDDGNHVEASIGLLAASMALIMPTMVVTLSLTQYDPDDEIGEGMTISPEEEEEPPPETPAVDAEGDVNVGGEDGTEPSASGRFNLSTPEEVVESPDVPGVTESPEPPGEEGGGADGGEDGAEEPAPKTSGPHARLRRMQRIQRRVRAGTGAVRLSEEGLLISLPGVALETTYTAQEVARYGLTQQSEIHVALMSGVF